MLISIYFIKLKKYFVKIVWGDKKRTKWIYLKNTLLSLKYCTAVKSGSNMAVGKHKPPA